MTDPLHTAMQNVDAAIGERPVAPPPEPPTRPKIPFGPLAGAVNTGPTPVAPAVRVGGKLPYHLVPAEYSMLMAAVLQHGAGDYPVRGFEKGYPIDDLIRGAEAHLTAIKGGEMVDAESGLPHAAHAAWNMLALATQLLRCPALITAHENSVAFRRTGALEALLGELRRDVPAGPHGVTPVAAIRRVLTEGKR